MINEIAKKSVLEIWEFLSLQAEHDNLDEIAMERFKILAEIMDVILPLLEE